MSDPHDHESEAEFFNRLEEEFTGAQNEGKSKKLWEEARRAELAARPDWGPVKRGLGLTCLGACGVGAIKFGTTLAESDPLYVQGSKAAAFLYGVVAVTSAAGLATLNVCDYFERRRGN